MNFDELSNQRRMFIEDLVDEHESVCNELSDLFIFAHDWQSFRQTAFKRLDEMSLNILKLKQRLMGL